MKKLRSINEFIGEVYSENTLWFCGGEFEFVNGDNLQKGDKVKISVGFDAVTLTDDESDGTVGANVTQSLYKGNYYQVQIYTDTDEDFYVDTTDEWDNNDRVGVLVDKNKITVSKIEDEDEES
jgi:spermidine/putrescine transport system ATP-binding protein